MADIDNDSRGVEMLDRFASRFDPKTRALLDEFVEHSEHGLAFEEVAGILAHGREPITADDLAYLRELGRSWESPRDPIPWGLLEGKAAR